MELKMSKFTVKSKFFFNNCVTYKATAKQGVILKNMLLFTFS